MRALLVAVVVFAGCGRCSRSESTRETPPQDAGRDRCALVGEPVLIGDPGGDGGDEPAPFGVEIGTAAGSDHGFEIGLRGAGLSAATSVVTIDLQGALRSTRALPKAAGARAPLVAHGAAGRFVGMPVAAGEGLRLRFEQGGTPFGAEILQTRDESEATSIAVTSTGLFVAWDEAEGGRGRIRLARPDREGSESVSPDATDASSPLLITDDAGTRLIVVWLAERPESIDDPDGGAGEPTQAEAQRWVEAVEIDLATGKPRGEIRALTPREGHAQTMAGRWDGNELVLAVRDDPRPIDGGGGTLIAVRTTLDGKVDAKAIAEKDVAPGVAFVLPTGRVVATDVEGAVRLVARSGEATIEPVLRGRTIVAAHRDLVLATRGIGRALEAVVARCR